MTGATFADSGRPRLVGQRVARIADERLLRAKGRYVDDIELPGMAHAHVIRSPVAHGTVVTFDASRALDYPGVVTVLSPADAAGLHLPCVWQQPGQKQQSYEVVSDVARYVGQPLGLVVADSRAIAEDAGELVDVDIQDSPAITR